MTVLFDDFKLLIVVIKTIISMERVPSNMAIILAPQCSLCPAKTHVRYGAYLGAPTFFPSGLVFISTSNVLLIFHCLF